MRRCGKSKCAVCSAARTQPLLSSIRAAELAVELSPSFALGHLVLGMASLYSGDAGRAVDWLELRLGLNRYDSQNFVWYSVLALAYLFNGNAEEALQRAVAAV